MPESRILLHVFNDVPQHYVGMLAFFSSIKLNHIDQHFAVEKPTKALSDMNKQALEQYPALNWFDSGQQLAGLIKRINPSQIVFHGLWRPYIWRMLAFNPSLLKISTWVCWGTDIHDVAIKWWSVRFRIHYFIRNLVAPKIRNVLALNQGDLDIVQSKHGIASGGVQPYPIIGISAPSRTEVASYQAPDVTRILVGNSASPANNHLSVFEQLKGFRHEKVQIVVPLNYAGHQSYVDAVVARGRELFADKFVPITEVMAKAEYDDLLSSIDIAVFGHNRQQGLYVAYYMLIHGKKLFVKGDTSSFETFAQLQLPVFDSNGIDALSFERFVELADELRVTSHCIATETFTESALRHTWASTFHRILEAD